MNPRVPLRRLHPPPQMVFAFLERSRRRERLFKWMIVLLTSALLVVVVRAFPWGRYLEASIRAGATNIASRAMGLARGRPGTDDDWRRFRQLGIEVTRPKVEQLYAEFDPAYQRLMRYAGLDPEHAVLRWGNFDWTLLLPSTVFQADDTGRQGRFQKPSQFPGVWD